MDIADDIAYSIHDVDDFYRAGVLSQGAVAREFRGWMEDAAELRELDDEALAARTAPPGSALEGLRRKLARGDAWIADDDAFADAVHGVADDLVDGLLASPFDGSIASERALSSFTNRWISHLQASVVPSPPDVVRSGLVTLDRRAWHEVETLKFVHRHFILDRADIVMYQRGLSRVLARAVKGLSAWATDEHDRRPGAAAPQGAHRDRDRRLRAASRVATRGRADPRRRPTCAGSAWAAGSSTTSPRSRTTRRSQCRRRSTGSPTGCGTSAGTSEPLHGAGGGLARRSPGRPRSFASRSPVCRPRSIGSEA